MKIIRALTDIHEKNCLSLFIFSFFFSLLLLSSSSLFFFSLLLLSSFSSLLFSSLAFLSCLVFSCLVLSLFLCLSLFLSPCCVMWCVSLWWWCRCGRGVVGGRGVCLVCCGTVKKREKKPCTRPKRFPCVDSKRPRVCRHQAHM